MDEFRHPRLTYVCFLVLLVTVLLSGVHQALAQVPDSTPVRTVDPVEPVQIEMNMPFAGNERNGFALMLTVPDKKRLVIEYVSGNAVLPTGTDIVSAFLTTTAGARFDGGKLPPTFQHQIIIGPRKPFSETFDITTFGQTVRSYADKNTDVFLSMSRNPTTGAQPNAFGTISGYFVPQP